VQTLTDQTTDDGFLELRRSPSRDQDGRSVAINNWTVIITRRKNIKNVTRGRDSRAAKSIEAR